MNRNYYSFTTFTEYESDAQPMFMKKVGNEILCYCWVFGAGLIDIFSTDNEGVSWKKTVTDSSQHDSYYNVFEYNGKWYAIADGSGTQWKVLSSTDAKNFKVERTYDGIGRYPVAYQLYDKTNVIGEEPKPINKWICVLLENSTGAPNRLLLYVSENLLDWSFHCYIEPDSGSYSGPPTTYTDIIYVNGVYWMYQNEFDNISDAPYNKVLHSHNGLDWTKNSLSLATYNPGDYNCWVYYPRVVYFKNKFYCEFLGYDTDSGNYKCSGAYSLDGINFNLTGPIEFLTGNKDIINSVVIDDKIWYSTFDWDYTDHLGFGYSDNGFIGVY